jgi:hypothetical protein
MDLDESKRRGRRPDASTVIKTRESEVSRFWKVVGRLTSGEPNPVERARFLLEAFGHPPYWFLYKERTLEERTLPGWLSLVGTNIAAKHGWPDYYHIRPELVMDAKEHRVGGYFEFQTAPLDQDWYAKSVYDNEVASIGATQGELRFMYFRSVTRSSRFRAREQRIARLVPGQELVLHHLLARIWLKAKVHVVRKTLRYAICEILAVFASSGL